MITGYVIRRMRDGKYVAPSGSEQSYTDDVTKAQVYEDRRDAQKDLCVESDVIVPLAFLFTSAQ